MLEEGIPKGKRWENSQKHLRSVREGISTPTLQGAMEDEEMLVHFVHDALSRMSAEEKASLDRGLQYLEESLDSEDGMTPERRKELFKMLGYSAAGGAIMGLFLTPVFGPSIVPFMAATHAAHETMGEHFRVKNERDMKRKRLQLIQELIASKTKKV